METMKKIIIYFSLLGHNREIAEKMAEQEKCKVKEFSPGNILRVFQFFGSKKRLRKKARRMDEELLAFDEIVICGPIWADRPARAIKSLLKYLTLEGKTVSCYMTYTQGYGKSEEIMKNMIEEQSGIVEEIVFKNVENMSDQ